MEPVRYRDGIDIRQMSVQGASAPSAVTRSMKSMNCCASLDQRSNSTAASSLLARAALPVAAKYHSSRRTCAGGNTESTRAARRQQHAPARPLRVRTSWRTHPTRVALPTPAPVPYHSSWRGRHDEWYPHDLRWSDERGHQCRRVRQERACSSAGHGDATARCLLGWIGPGCWG